jgi:hypothetical protein
MAVPLTDHLISQGRALVRAIEALGTIEPTGPFERAFLQGHSQSLGKLGERAYETV